MSAKNRFAADDERACDDPCDRLEAAGHARGAAALRWVGDESIPESTVSPARLSGL